MHDGRYVRRQQRFIGRPASGGGAEILYSHQPRLDAATVAIALIGPVADGSLAEAAQSIVRSIARQSLDQPITATSVSPHAPYRPASAGIRFPAHERRRWLLLRVHHGRGRPGESRDCEENEPAHPRPHVPLNCPTTWVVQRTCYRSSVPFVPGKRVKDRRHY